jgi:hypothetical protein
MRTIVTTTDVYPYDELSDKAKETARENLVRELAEMGIVTGMLREVAADFLTNLGWTDLDELRFEDNGPDLNKLQFSISHSQGDFVAWGSTVPWKFLATEFTIRTYMNRNGNMDVRLFDADGDVTDELVDEVIHGAYEFVKETQAALLSLMHKTDLDLSDDGEYLSDFSVANDIEFTEDGAIYR